jgi:hypothetical protein
MKTLNLFIASATLMTMPACEKAKPLSGKAQDGVNDALDRRPGENVRDAAEDASDAVKDTGKEVKDAVKEATR